jgi:glycerol-3-phosphate acyltransferase PlsX
MRVVVDAMGSDRAPEPELAGALRAVHARPELSVILVGNGLGSSSHEQIRFVHASQVVTMTDHPAAVFRAKPDSSLRVAVQLVGRGEADAIVSAGNSGAVLAAAVFVLGRAPGVDRPAIVAALPGPRGGRPVILADAGANVDPRPAMVAQFGALGAAYARATLGLSRPRIGLLSNGAEPGKGTELTRAAHALLAELRGAFEYIGYVEGHELFGGTVDVVATDGFTGNVVVKTCEALLDGEAELGGALLAGVTRPVVIAHGRSDEVAMANAILTAARFAASPLALAL